MNTSWWSKRNPEKSFKSVLNTVQGVKNVENYDDATNQTLSQKFTESRYSLWYYVIVM
jgi:hypothetical protein